MSIPELVRRRMHKQLVDFCLAVVPERQADKELLDFMIRHNRVTLFYAAPAWTEPVMRKSLLGQFRYDAQTATWRAYVMLDERKWICLEEQLPIHVFGEFLKAIEANFKGAFACRALKTTTEEFCKLFDLGSPTEF